MDGLIFLMGLIIGALISYFYLAHSYKKRAKGEGNDLLGRTTRAEHELRELRAELARCKQQSAQLKLFEEQCRQKSEECRNLAEKLSTTESQLQALQEQAEQAESEARTTVEPPNEEKPEAPQAKESPAPEKVDDFRKIRGIGPKVAQHLQDSGIKTFAQLAQAEPEHLHEILEAGGRAYKGRDPQSWPEQAKLAAKEDWDALKELRAQLNG
ncbi:MAG: DUF4332 domain-containing protein [bacterium]|nr:DUF4332 domain-containing protein [bacterium]